jgi:hypothetical protein
MLACFDLLANADKRGDIFGIVDVLAAIEMDSEERSTWPA